VLVPTLWRHHGQGIRLYGPTVVAQSRWEIYNLAAEHVFGATLDANGAWLPDGLASGIYIARVTVHGVDGSESVFTQKIAIVQ
jgi:hypothetical protein